MRIDFSFPMSVGLNATIGAVSKENEGGGFFPVMSWYLNQHHPAFFSVFRFVRAYVQSCAQRSASFAAAFFFPIIISCICPGVESIRVSDGFSNPQARHRLRNGLCLHCGHPVGCQSSGSSRAFESIFSAADSSPKPLKYTSTKSS